MNYKICLSYDGSRYDGWQKQGNTDKTIQGKLEEILFKRTGHAVQVHGSGRTDAGVHAEGQVANFNLENGWWKEADRSGKAGELAVMDYLNQYLPEDIAVWQCKQADSRFHSRLNAVEKTYRYQIETGLKKDVFQRGYYYGLGKELDLKAMRQAADYVTGVHDFKSFCGNRKIKKSTVRTLKRIEILKYSDTKLHILYTGNGFLQQMVRILTGTLIEVGLGKRMAGEMACILEAKDRQAAGFTAPALGLFLVKVEYGEEK